MISEPKNFSHGRQIVYIHGGDTFDTYEEYVNKLKTGRFDPFRNNKNIWPSTLPEIFGEENVINLTMPCKQNAKYAEWKIWFERLVPFLENEVVFVCWSLGANFIAKYLSENALSVKINAVHMIAGCFGAPGGFTLPESLALFAKQAEHIFLYHSTDDVVVPFFNFGKYADALPLAERVEFLDRNHFHTTQEFPELIDNISKTGPVYR